MVRILTILDRPASLRARQMHLSETGGPRKAVPQSIAAANAALVDAESELEALKNYQTELETEIQRSKDSLHYAVSNVHSRVADVVKNAPATAALLERYKATQAELMNQAATIRLLRHGCIPAEYLGMRFQRMFVSSPTNDGRIFGSCLRCFSAIWAGMNSWWVLGKRDDHNTPFVAIEAGFFSVNRKMREHRARKKGAHNYAKNNYADRTWNTAKAGFKHLASPSQIPICLTQSNRICILCPKALKAKSALMREDLAHVAWRRY